MTNRYQQHVIDRQLISGKSLNDLELNLAKPVEPEKPGGFFSMFSSKKQAPAVLREEFVDGFYPFCLKLFGMMMGKSAFYFHSNFTEQLLKSVPSLDAFEDHKNSTGHNFMKGFKNCFRDVLSQNLGNDFHCLLIAEFADPVDLEHYTKLSDEINQKNYPKNLYPKIKIDLLQGQNEIEENIDKYRDEIGEKYYYKICDFKNDNNVDLKLPRFDSLVQCIRNNDRILLLEGFYQQNNLVIARVESCAHTNVYCIIYLEEVEVAKVPKELKVLNENLKNVDNHEGVNKLDENGELTAANKIFPDREKSLNLEIDQDKFVEIIQTCRYTIAF